MLDAACAGRLALSRARCAPLGLPVVIEELDGFLDLRGDRDRAESASRRSGSCSKSASAGPCPFSLHRARCGRRGRSRHPCGARGRYSMSGRRSAPRWRSRANLVARRCAFGPVFYTRIARARGVRVDRRDRGRRRDRVLLAAVSDDGAERDPRQDEPELRWPLKRLRAPRRALWRRAFVAASAQRRRAARREPAPARRQGKEAEQAPGGCLRLPRCDRPALCARRAG